MVHDECQVRLAAAEVHRTERTPVARPLADHIGDQLDEAADLPVLVRHRGHQTALRREDAHLHQRRYRLALAQRTSTLAVVRLGRGRVARPTTLPLARRPPVGRDADAEFTRLVPGVELAEFVAERLADKPLALVDAAQILVERLLADLPLCLVSAPVELPDGQPPAVGVLPGGHAQHGADGRALGEERGQRPFPARLRRARLPRVIRHVDCLTFRWRRCGCGPARQAPSTSRTGTAADRRCRRDEEEAVS